MAFCFASNGQISRRTTDNGSNNIPDIIDDERAGEALAKLA